MAPRTRNLNFNLNAKKRKKAQPPPEPSSQSETEYEAESESDSSEEEDGEALGMSEDKSIIDERRKKIEAKSFKREKAVELAEGEYEEEFRAELVKRKWLKLASPHQEYNPKIVREFYLYAYDRTQSKHKRESKIGNIKVPFDRDTINNYLGKPLELNGDQLCEYQKRKNSPINGSGGFSNGLIHKDLCVPGRHSLGSKIFRSRMTTRAQIWMTFVLHNISPSTHVSSLALNDAYIVWTIMKGHTMDVAQIISDEIFKAAKLEKSTTALPFPSLITQLCKAHGVLIPRVPQEKLKPPINAKYIARNCTNEAEEVVVEAAQGSQSKRRAPPPPTQSATASIEDPMQAMKELMKQLLRQNEEMFDRQEKMCTRVEELHTKQDNMALALNQLRSAMQDQLYVRWPEDSPHPEEGERPGDDRAGAGSADGDGADAAQG